MRRSDDTFSRTHSSHLISRCLLYYAGSCGRGTVEPGVESDGSWLQRLGRLCVATRYLLAEALEERVLVSLAVPHARVHEDVVGRSDRAQLGAVDEAVLVALAVPHARVREEVARAAAGAVNTQVNTGVAEERRARVDVLRGR